MLKIRSITPISPRSAKKTSIINNLKVIVMEKSSQNPSFGQGLELVIIAAKAIASAAKKNKTSDETIQKIVHKPGVVFEFFEKLLAEAIEAEKKNSILSLISGGEKLIIESSDGKAHIFDAKKTFKSGIDGNFKNWGLNQSGPATKGVLVDVSEMVGDGTFVQIFTSITPDLDKIVMTQAQIIRFCEKYPIWLRQEGYATLFLTKVNSEHLVVCVYVPSDGLGVGVSRLGSDVVGRGEYRHRVVSPQFSSSSLLHLLSGGQELKLKALSGSRLICQAEETFKSFIDSNFVSWGLNKPGLATPETPMQVHEIVGDGTFMDIFLSLLGTWDQKWLSQDQVIEFCETLPGWLKQEGYATFFLVKKDENKPIDENKPEDNLVVVDVRVTSVGLSVDVDRLGLDSVWDGEFRHRVVSPKLMPSVA